VVAPSYANTVGGVVEADQPFKRSAAQIEALVDIEALEAHYLSSSHGVRSSELVSAHLVDRASLAARTMDPTTWSAYTRSQYGQQFPHSTAFHTALCCQRQVKLMGRNLTMVIPRIFNAKLGLIQNGVMFMAFANFQELPVASEGKQVVVRQVDAGFYPAVSYTIAVNLLTIPLAVLEAIVFGTILYWLPVRERDTCSSSLAASLCLRRNIQLADCRIIFVRLSTFLLGLRRRAGSFLLLPLPPLLDLVCDVSDVSYRHLHRE
jgi:hypothetical protein